MAGSLGGGGFAGGGGGVDGCDAKSVTMEMSPSPSSCGMAHIRSVSAPSRLFVGSTGCGRFRFRLAGGAGGDGLVTAPALLTVVATSYLAVARVRRVAASAAARGAAAVGRVAIAASQYVAATAAWGAAVAAVAVAAAAAAVGAAAAFAPGSTGAGPPKTLARSLRSLAQAVLLFFLCSCLRAPDRRLTSCCSAVCWLPWTRAQGGLGVSEVSFEGRQEKSKRSRPPRVSNTTLPQPRAATHARY
jgi:hypothetical protein